MRTMTMRVAIAAAAVGLAVLAGCGSGDSGGSGDAGGATAAERSTAAQSTTPGSAAPESPAAGAVLATADSPLGRIVVDGQGRTVYVFDRDTAGSGTSVCSGACLQAWPAVTAGSADVPVDGVTGRVGTITRDDGTLQATLDGLPLYYYAADAQAGDVTGQGVQGVWWVVGPDGTRITGTASSSAAPPMPGY